LTPDSLKNLDSSDKIVDDMKFQSNALSITRNALSENKSLVGFVGGPWTLLSYGTGIKNETNIDDLHKNEFYEKLLYDVLIPALYQIIEMQLKSSAEIVYMFDTNASQLQSNYFISKYIEEIKEGIFSAFPNQVAYFCKENPILVDPKSNLKYQLAGMVYGENEGLETILPKLESGFLQGNFDPKNLLLPEKEFQFEVDNFIKIFRNLSDTERSGWVCSLSHGVLPKAREDNVRYFIEKVRSNFR
jgi:Uroporphyrinogen-III decarboxylase